MESILWVGPGGDSSPLRTALEVQGLEIFAFEDLETAIRAAEGIPMAAAIVSVDWASLPEAVRQLRRHVPDVQILVATRLGVPTHVTVALNSGAQGLLDLSPADPHEIVGAIQRSIAEHRQHLRERRLLEKLHHRLETFLKAMVQQSMRSMELEDQLATDAPAADQPMRVLIIDDDDALRVLLETLLTDRGYEVRSAATAHTGLQILRTQYFHLLITDKNLPDHDGHEVARSAKTMRPDIAVVMMTAYSTKESILEALDSGIVGYLEKPFDDIDHVGKKIDGWLEHRRWESNRTRYLQAFKERNSAFLEEYRVIRRDPTSARGSRFRRRQRGLAAIGLRHHKRKLSSPDTARRRAAGTGRVPL